MKVKDVKAVLDRKRDYFEDLQQIELKLRNNNNLCDKLNQEFGTVNIMQAIIEARMCFYDNEILRRENLIDNAEIQD